LPCNFVDGGIFIGHMDTKCLARQTSESTISLECHSS
jgi:hypothetical protein